VLGKLARQQDPNVLVGFDRADDAGVYLLAPDLALVQTVDFFTPIVDDPYTFGQIAATNSLSDVYAMGGRPTSALALVCFPEKGDLEVLEAILAGGLSKMIEAGCTVVGGHSIRDEEIKFGYAVNGTVHPQHVLTNAGAQPGDRLLLTKALGTGVISTAIKRQQAEPEWIAAAIASMTTLNKRAAEIITGCRLSAVGSPPDRSALEGGGLSAAGPRSDAGSREPGAGSRQPRADSREPAGDNRPPVFRVHALTDITGFGLIGHAREMAIGSNVSLQIHGASVPLLPGARECANAGFIPGGLKANRDFAGCVVEWEADVPELLRPLLFDPQTAGGLLISVAPGDARALQDALSAADVPAAEIGEVLTPGKPMIRVST
jgi:selenide,water dikinase